VTPNGLPVLGFVFDSGPEDRVFDALLLLGPAIIVLIVVVGRSLLTSGVAIGYLAAIVSYVLYKAVR